MTLGMLDVLAQPFAWVMAAPPGRCRAIAGCRFCGWRVQVTGDDPFEVGLLLTQFVTRHHVDAHETPCG